MEYSAIQGLADGYKGFKDNEDKIAQRNERDFNLENKKETRRMAIEDRAARKKRQAISDTRATKAYEQQQFQYDYKLEEQKRQNIERKGMRALANWEASGGKKGMQELLDAYDDPDDDFNYTEIRLNPNGGITLLGDENTDDFSFKDIQHFKDVVTAELAPDKYHQTQQQALKSRYDKQLFSEKETIKTNNKIKINKAKAELEKQVKNSGNIPAKLQITNAIVERYKKLYPDVDVKVLWLHAFNKATRTGKSQEQAVADFAKSITTSLSKNAYSAKDRAQISKDVQSMAKDFSANYFGEKDAQGLPTDMPKKAIPVVQDVPNDAPQAIQDDAPKQEKTAPVKNSTPPQSFIAKAREKYRTGAEMYSDLYSKDKEPRRIYEAIKHVFPNWKPKIR